MQPAATWQQDYWWPKMAKKMKPLKPGKPRIKSMGGKAPKRGTRRRYC